MLLNIIAWIVVGGLAGWVASLIMKTNGSMGIVLNIVVGIVGAILGGWIVSALLGADPELFSLGGFLTAVLGAVVLLAIVKLFTRGNRV